MWRLYALLSAVFAALTLILAKLGVVITMVLAFVTLRKKISLKAVIGGALITAGTLIPTL